MLYHPVATKALQGSSTQHQAMPYNNDNLMYITIA